MSSTKDSSLNFRYRVSSNPQIAMVVVVFRASKILVDTMSGYANPL
jgi:hypothetical protein